MTTHEFEDDDWDRQMREDAEAGRLDHLAEAAENEARLGLCRPLEELFEDKPVTTLDMLRDRKIPDLTEARSRYPGYRQHPIDTVYRLYNEPMVDLKDYGIDGLNHYAHAQNPPYCEIIPGSTQRLLLRKTVARQLQGIDERLRKQGLKLFVYDAWRPTAVQIYFHDFWMPNQLQRANPELKGDALTREVEQYWAAPTVDPSSPSPHLTGAAVDLTLAYLETGHPLFMGSVFDDTTSLAHTDHYEKFEPLSYSDIEARANRRLLYWTMTEAGFCNQPYEWWHYNLGDQMWAKLTGQPAAFYGPAEFKE